MYTRLRPCLFRLDAERAHAAALNAARLAGAAPPLAGLLRRQFEVRDPRLAVEVFGLRFRNPVGVAAGYDKNGVAVKGLDCLGFGHVEVGTVTRLPQPGNPRPRLHRLPRHQALINSLGFPNRGAAALRIARGAGVVGVNIGKGQDTPLERAAEDYTALLRAVRPQADYVTINISSPNTLGLRRLQARAALEALLEDVMRARAEAQTRLPVLVKIGPDLTEAELDDVLAAATARGVDGIIATNTTVSRAGLSAPWADVPGGLSGQPLKARATDVIRYIARHTQGRLPIVGAGGIASAADALEKLRAGARLVQVYTGLVYAGPGLARQINLGVLQALAAEGARHPGELINLRIAPLEND